mmetsp:Transcript_15011/g.16992  ORF Transcript_15011/g.16992 Transcript_15011/m.16992 type:complete len:272 (+) Transcript_15011:192-1007(+)|eukprot:CAMPEP_0184009132 /NCGR_PEP_ID=MMETSP0954-20121128/2412_1 /TAXON_ID=627963 /ORGANISM="Aplanochytrium sp, Strain PBS07" /LENGTH=271 /DNA_ID=CAMNT_0026288425 /DNA_START=150 /DNA_END=965 /DNA_ORIENTATION=+
MGRIHKISECWVKFINGFLLSLGLGMLGLGAYVLFSGYQDAYEVGLQDFGVAIPLMAGIIIFMIGVIGYLGAKKQSVGLLVFYLVLMLLTLCAVFAVTVVMFAYAGAIDDVQVGSSEEQIEDLNERINDFQVAVFDVCCAEEGFGPAVLPCTGNTTDGCYVGSEDSFDSLKKAVSQTLCQSLEKVEIDNGAPLVGDPNATSASCGGGDAATFADELGEYLEDRVVIAAYILACVCGLLFITMIFSIFLMCKKEDEYDSGTVQAYDASGSKY